MNRIYRLIFWRRRGCHRGDGGKRSLLWWTRQQRRQTAWRHSVVQSSTRTQTSTTQRNDNQAGSNRFSQHGIDRVAGLYVSGPAGVLLASAGSDIKLSAAQVRNAGSGATQLKAGGDVKLNTVEVGRQR